MSTPLTDIIENLTDYINEITGSDDTTLSDAIYTLAEGYGDIKLDNWANGTAPRGDIVINSNSIFVNTFTRRTTITGISLPNATYVESSAFSIMGQLRSFSAPKLERCLDSMLSNDVNLKNVYLPNLSETGTGTFMSSGVERISLPSLISVKSNTFRECRFLETVKLASCTKIEATNAFYNCTALTDIYLPNAESTYTGAPWGATNATIHYNTIFDENGEPVTTDIPEEYQKIEYIMSTETGGQYINTEITGTGNSDIKIEISYAWDVLPESNSYQMIIGAYQSEASSTTRILQKGSNTTYVGLNRYAHKSTVINQTRLIDTIYNDILTFNYYESNGTKTTINDVATGTSINDTLHLFASSRLNSFAKSLKLYECTIFNEKGFVVRKFIPCFDKSNNNVGLYDTVTDEFYENGGTGSFISGPSIQ